MVRRERLDVVSLRIKGAQNHRRELRGLNLVVPENVRAQFLLKLQILVPFDELLEHSAQVLRILLNWLAVARDVVVRKVRRIFRELHLPRVVRRVVVGIVGL